jgi:hypothetical protein
MSDINLTRVNNDTNGNPRYATHFLNLLTAAEKARSGAAWIDVPKKYEIALRRAHAIGGRKFHNKQFGGGIVFQCYGGADIGPHIARVLSEAQADEAQAENLFLSVINDSATYRQRQQIAKAFHQYGLGTRAYDTATYDYEQLARAEAKKPHNKGTKFSQTAFILAAHDTHAYMVEHYRESNNGAEWL